MVLIVKSPYPDDETRIKLVAEIIEDIIKSNWNATITGIDAEDDIAFGVFGNKILQSGKEITLRAYQIFENVTRLDVSGNRREYFETLIVDVYVLNNDSDTQRDPRAIKIMKWFDEFFILNEGIAMKGIYSIDYKGSRIDSDPESSNITRVKATLDVRYILDKVIV